MSQDIICSSSTGAILWWADPFTNTIALDTNPTTVADGPHAGRVILSDPQSGHGAPLQLAADALAELGRAIEANDADALERKINAAREQLSRFACNESQEEEAPDDGHPTAASN